MKSLSITSSNLLFPLLMVLWLSTCTSCHAQKEKNIDKVYATKAPGPGGTGKVYMGREIARVIGTGGGNWLERSTRQEDENSLLAIDNMMLKPQSVVADIGAGTGFYTFRVAERVPQGKVYAVELQDAFIATLKERKQELGLNNVEVVKGGTQSINVPDATLDLAFMVDVYHELEYPQEMLQAIHKALKPGGKLVLLEYRAEDPKVAIRELHKMSAAQVKKELEANGFKLHKQVDALPIQHFLMFEKEDR
ncbi:ubiquinone/menaquinone biosynthesis C-methylase UbiE [Pontibacter aydingkolensis]|uniref:Class I SAM-dependent methyltransferase n=1 Tax=Pontibacter aydingkolensis TaxID=1911536 RepID=A0ABS7CUD8_9BACT|nr:methyltransferase domain-containing protein [Pontibacter aydingkolensis]MBW7467447.1 class I SAM-dependent methyltransferase [Pontibacter aydingkolensis]